MTTQTERPDLASLLDRVRSATGPDAELDIDLCIGLDYIGYTDNPLSLRRAKEDDGWLDYETVEDGHTVDCSDQAPELTASIDAALALVERLLPGLSWGIDRTDEGDAEPWFDCVVGGAFAQHNTAPLAILEALLSALTKEGAQ